MRPGGQVPSTGYIEGNVRGRWDWGIKWIGGVEVRKTQAVIRGWCFVAASLYLVVLLVVVAVLIGRDTMHQSQHSWGENLIGPAVVIFQLSALSLFGWGLVVWSPALAWKVRLSAWLMLFAGLIPLVSFSIFLAPLLMSMAPALWPWRELKRRIET